MSDLLIRSAEFSDAEAIAHLHVASWRDAYRGMIPDAVLDGPLLDERMPMWRQVLAITPAGRLVLVATARPPEAAAAGGEAGAPTEIPPLLGFASGGRLRGRRARYDAEIYTLYIAAAARRQNIGCRLMASMAIRLKLFGHDSAMLWTLADNGPARRFYEMLDGEPAGTRTERFGGAALDEVAYAWPRLDALLHACSDRLSLASGAA
jgi:ribosomal protein S18 acetylase RimI-like enzyme